jgi:hypothetical protein
MCHPSRTKKFHKQAAKNTFYARLSVAKNAAIFLSFEVLSYKSSYGSRV